MMMTLSERFGRIKAVTVDSTESETDFSDDSLFPKKLNTFKYSNTPTLSFTANFSNKAGEESHEEYDDDEEESDDEVLDMESDWKEHYHKILVKSKNVSGNHEKHVCLSDKVPAIDKSLPLQCLKSSLEQYNRSQLPDDDKNLATSDDLIFERSENEFDICDENTSVDKGNRKVDNQVDADIEKEECCLDLDNSYLDIVDNASDLTEPTVENITDDPVTNVVPETNENTVIHLDVIDTTKTESDTKLHTELDNISVMKVRHEVSIPLAQESMQDIHEVENCKSRNQVDTHSGEMKCGQSVIEEKTNFFVNESQQSFLSDNRETRNSNISHSELENEAKVVSSEHEKGLEKESCFDHENNTLLPVNTIKSSNKSLKEAKVQEKAFTINPNDPNVSDTLLSKQDERKVSKRSVPQKETKGQILLDKSDKDMVKSSLVSQSKKLPIKVKTSEIKPSFSFPLDELLPPLEIGNKTSAKKNTEETMSAGRKTSSETTESESSASVISNSKAPGLFNESDVFHGTVYDNSPVDEIPPYQHRSFDGHDRMAKQRFSGVTNNEYDEELDTGMTNLIAALQNGDQHVIKVFQAALNDQIGSNLNLLAAKARGRDQTVSQSERGEHPSSFGFYTERMNSDTNRPDETGDNTTNEKYDDLLNLFIEQCSALVETEEDSSKLKYLMTLLQKESEMKFKSKGFTPSSDVEGHLSQPDVSHSSHGSVQSETGLHCKLEADLFEGRTLLKGGVEPRHIPKTTVRKPGQERSKDPRVKKILENREPQIKLPLPAFAVKLYGEKKVKRILHLDWDAQFSASANLSTLLNEKDPRIRKKSPTNSQITPIDNASVESLQLSNETFPNHNKEENKSQIYVESPSRKCLEPFKKSCNETELTSSKAIPVLITPQKEVDNGRCVKSFERNPVLHSIDLQNSYTATVTETEPSKQNKKVNVGVVKPLIEKQTSKENKLSVGIVKPIQIKSTTVKPKTESRGDVTPLISSQTVSTKNSFDNEKYESKGHNVAQVKMLPSGTDQENDPIVIDSDSEEGEITMEERADTCNKRGSKTISESFKNRKGKTESKFGEGLRNNALQSKRNVQNTNTENTNFSDVSSYEDGEIDTLLDKSFNEKSSRDKNKLFRSYRKRERSSSRSSVESRMSHNSYTKYRLEEQKNKHTSPRSKSTDKPRGDRSRSEDRNSKRGLHKETSEDNQRQRPKDYTGRKDESFRDYSDMSESSKRYHSFGNMERKRHKTQEDYKAIESYKNRLESKDHFKSKVSGIYDTTYAKKSEQKTKLSETVPYKYNDVCLSDEEISKEYHELFGKPKPISLNTFKKESTISNTSNLPSKLQKPVKNDKTNSSHGMAITLQENEIHFLGKNKTKRKSLEDLQKEVLEDKKFLENCKKKILGDTSTGNKKLVSDRNKSYNCVEKVGQAVQKTLAASARTSDLEEGEI